MAEFPALPLFTDSYLGDTRHLTTLQHGAYLLMLIVAWRSTDCSLPNDDVYLARITGLDRRTWNANKTILLAFWHLNEQQKWEQARLKDERNFVEHVRNKNSAAGKASALKRLNRASTSVQPNRNQNPTPTPTPTIEVSKDTSPPTPLPDWLPMEEWNSFKQMRKRMRSPMTPKAEQLAIAQLDKLSRSGGDAKAIIEQSILRGWKSFYPLKEDYHATGNNHPTKPTFQSEGQRLADKYRAEAEREEQAADHRDTESGLHLAKAVREDSR